MKERATDLAKFIIKEEIEELAKEYDGKPFKGPTALSFNKDENVIYFNTQAFGKSNCSMDEILVHEEAHISLYAGNKPEYYEVDGCDLRKISNNEKLINADNWRKFYSEAIK